ncbi:MAG: acyltransferase [Proteobacteria bacterium]|jgi:peptidoglycan/LPS O-acetylase OafA/YrhL|nr:acyltransferase [Pseudomonadota bacterium]
MSNLWQSITDWRDQLITHKPSTGPLVENFDGVRAVAAIMVFLQHLGTVPHVVFGPVGVWLFFTLSGYLLYLVFLRIEQPLPTGGTLIAYFTRRLFRIVPLFVVVLVVMSMYWTQPWGEINPLWINLHLLGLMGDHHLWTIKVELIFYLFLPFLILVLAPIINPKIRLIILLALAFPVWWYFEHKMVLVLHGGMPYFTPFILGMAAVHAQPMITPRVGKILTCLGLLGILGFGLDVGIAEKYRHFIGFTDWMAMWAMGHFVYPACMLLVIGVASYKSRFWGNPWLRLLGVVGYGFYLWHPVVIIYVRDFELPNWQFNIACFVASFALALVGYLLIEKPGIAFGKYLARKISNRKNPRLLAARSAIFIFICAFFVIRATHPFDFQISIQAEIYSEQPTLTQFFTTETSEFSEKDSKFFRIDGGRWEARTFNIREFRINKLRFDPGNAPGTYRIRNLNIEFPWLTGPLGLDVAKLIPVSGIAEVSQNGDELIIRTNPGETDPILVYEGDLYQPLLRPWSMAILSVLAGWLLLYYSSRGLDLLASRFGTNLNGKRLLA